MDGRIVSRRQVVARIGAVVAPSAAPVRLAPRDQLVNVLEYEEQAKSTLPPNVYGLIAGSDRTPFDRITLRPRMLVPTLDLDLSITLFGETLFAPIVVAPIADQKRFHPDGELAMLKGASAAKAPVVVSSQSSIAVADLVAAATTPLWYQVFASDPAAKEQMRTAIDAGCRGVCVTVGAKPTAGGMTPVRVDWNVVGGFVAGSGVPVIVKGVTSAADARAALQQNARAIIISNHGGIAPQAEPILMQVPTIVDAVAGRVPVLVDGGFRRGTDILKALALGAQAVLIGRPVMWGLAAYGAEGVQGVIEMLQTELARYMAMCGHTRVATLRNDVLRVHAAAARPTTSSSG